MGWSGVVVAIYAAWAAGGAAAASVTGQHTREYTKYASQLRPTAVTPGLEQLWLAAEYCQSRDCNPDTAFWVWHNLALEAERQHAAHKSQGTLARTKALFQLAVDADPSQGAALGLARAVGEEQGAAGSFEVLRKYESKASEHQ